MIRIAPAEPEHAARGYVRHVACIDAASAIDDVWFITPADAAPAADDWLVPIGALVGMATGEDVHIAGRVSERLLAATEEIQRITVARHEGLQPVAITADEVAPTPRATEPRTLSCFSCGVDAFYTSLDPEAGIDELLYVHGLETYRRSQRMLRTVVPRVRMAAHELGRPLRLVETNWRDVIEPIARHSYFTTVPLLYSVGHLMSSRMTRLILPGTNDPFYAANDPSAVRSYVTLWSSEALETMEHGHVPRLEKVRRLAESDVAMRHLRVCWERNLPIYNCGECIKCIRTRVHLKLAGAEGRCRSLPRRLVLDEVRFAHPELSGKGAYDEENIAAAEAQGLTDLADALRAQRDGPPDRRRSRSPGERLQRSLRRIQRQCRNRLCDASLALLRRRSRGDHLFNFLGGPR